MKLCLLDVGGDFLLATPTKAVLELSRDLQLTPVPLSPAVLAGIADLHGEILPIFRSSRIFPGVVPERRDFEPQIVVLQADSSRFGLRIRQVDIIALKDEDDSVDSADSTENSGISDENSEKASQEQLFVDELPSASYKELATDQNATVQAVKGFEGIYRRTLEVENRGVVRELDLSALSRCLQESLMAFDLLAEP